MSEPDDKGHDLDALRALPPRDADPEHAALVRARALAAFDVAHGGDMWLARATALWSRVLLPTVLAGAVGVYLTWAVRAASALYH